MAGVEDLVVVISGSSRGVGQAIAEAFGFAGAKVVVNSLSSVEEGTAVANGLPDACYVQADVSTDAGARLLIERVLDRWGRVDVVVNNAGAAVIGDERDLDSCTDDVWQQMLSSNLMSAWYLSRAAVTPMRAAGSGSILNISSVAGMHPVGSGISIAYSAAKAALNHLTVLLANLLGPDGIRVNAVALGAVETAMWRSGADRIRDAMRSQTVLGRAAEPSEISDIVVALAGHGYLTGEVVVVDGGMRFRVPR